MKTVWVPQPVKLVTLCRVLVNFKYLILTSFRDFHDRKKNLVQKFSTIYYINELEIVQIYLKDMVLKRWMLSFKGMLDDWIFQWGL